ncbi:RNA polymerase II [Phlyctochytrium bullatum]|nr:RNA polymerase II [Phlyctochytrium bullatum]
MPLVSPDSPLQASNGQEVPKENSNVPSRRRRRHAADDASGKTDIEARHDLTIPENHLPAMVLEVRVGTGDKVQKGEEVLIYEYTTLFQYRIRDRLDPTRTREATVPKQVKGAVVTNYTGVVGDVKTTPEKRFSQSLSLAVIAFKPDYMGCDGQLAERLLTERRLSLILDLDQTVIHATVDPTVGEWLKDKSNPNNTALEDVHAFRLPDSPVIYYIKLRPGTKDFLKRMHALYELHIYTMGTKNYAHEVCKILDPDRKLFQDRILSRDDSGSFHIKRIQRLFPCDQSMVVVVDDRADVWQWPPNLVRVRPYDFFVGIGDINEPMRAGRTPIEKDPTRTGHASSASAGVLAPIPLVTLSNPALQETVLRIENGLDDAYANEVQNEEDLANQIMTEMSTAQKAAFDEQVKTRPLAQQQNQQTITEVVEEISELKTVLTESMQVTQSGEEREAIVSKTESIIASSINILDDIENLGDANFLPQETISSLEVLEKSLKGDSLVAVADGANDENNSITKEILDKQPTIASIARETSVSLATSNTSIRKRPILVDSDMELQFVERVLSEVHRKFYEALEAGATSPVYSNVAEKPPEVEADVRAIMPSMKAEILKGCRIVFSGVIPKEVPLHITDTNRLDGKGGEGSTAAINSIRSVNAGVSIVDEEEKDEEDLEDLLPASGADDIFTHMKHDDWDLMMDEVNEAMEDDDDDDDESDDSKNSSGHGTDVGNSKKVGITSSHENAESGSAAPVGESSEESLEDLLDEAFADVNFKYPGPFP